MGRLNDMATQGVEIMDRDEALKLLTGGEKGILEWNRRRLKSEEIPDLSGAILRRADLSAANRRGAHLYKAKLCHAKLMQANLGGANVYGADLSGANLYGAILSGAILSRADLTAAILIWADLRGANLSEAVCEVTMFADVDLSEAKGLDSVRHLGPSTVGIDTLFQSKGKIPEAFLRGCGVPDALLGYRSSVIGALQPIQFYSCFISYSTKDEDFAEAAPLQDDSRETSGLVRVRGHEGRPVARRSS